MNSVCSNFSKSQANLIGVKNSVKKNIKVKDMKKKQLKQQSSLGDVSQSNLRKKLKTPENPLEL